MQRQKPYEEDSWQKKTTAESDDARKRREADTLETNVANNPYGPDQKDYAGNTHMHNAVNSRNLHSIRKLLLQSASMRVRNNASDTPIAQAFKLGYMEELEVFSQLCKDDTIDEADKRILAKHRSIHDVVSEPRRPRPKPAVKAPVHKPAHTNVEKLNYSAGLFSAPAPAAKPAPMQSQPAAGKPFMEEDIALISKYIEKLEKTGSIFEKGLIEQIKDPVSFLVMRDPVYLRPEGRTFDRDTLEKMVQSKNGVKVCPFNGKPFTDEDITADVTAIQRIQLFLDAAMAEQQKQPEQSVVAMRM